MSTQAPDDIQYEQALCSLDSLPSSMSGVGRRLIRKIVAAGLRESIPEGQIIDTIADKLKVSRDKVLAALRPDYITSSRPPEDPLAHLRGAVLADRSS